MDLLEWNRDTSRSEAEKQQQLVTFVGITRRIQYLTGKIIGDYPLLVAETIREAVQIAIQIHLTEVIIECDS